MTFPIREPSKCPKCFERTFNVKESRTPGNLKTYIRRRRKVCSMCGYKTTTYEITGEEYEEYLANKKIIDSLKRVLTVKRSCNQCTHYYNYSCRLEIPELDAEECSYYSLT